MALAKFSDVQAAVSEPLPDNQSSRVDGLLRRAERELALIVGDLSRYDDQLVRDTLVDAVVMSGAASNPDQFRSESDGGYSYSRFEVPGLGGRYSRFWWPKNLHELFGLPAARAKIKAHRVGPATPKGWMR